MLQAALDNHQPGFAMITFNASSPPCDRSLAEIKQWFPAFKILRQFDVRRLSTVFSPIHPLGPAAILACTEDLLDPHRINSSYFSHSPLR